MASGGTLMPTPYRLCLRDHPELPDSFWGRYEAYMHAKLLLNYVKRYTHPNKMTICKYIDRAGHGLKTIGYGKEWRAWQASIPGGVWGDWTRTDIQRLVDLIVSTTAPSKMAVDLPEYRRMQALGRR